MRRYILLLISLVGFGLGTSAQTVINMPFVQNPEFSVSAENVYVTMSSTGMTLGADLVITGGSGTYIYEWSKDSTSLSKEATLYITEAGVYILRIVDTCDCEKYVTFNVVPTSVESTRMASYTVYPNPTKGILYIRSAGGDEPVQMSLVSAAGKVVKIIAEPCSEQGVVTLDLTPFPVGEYILNCVSADKKVENTKIVLTK